MTPSPRTIPPALLADLQAHLAKADAKHGPMPAEPSFILTVCGEELGEVATTILEGEGQARTREELLDLAAAALRGAEALSCSHASSLPHPQPDEHRKLA